jgi:hypothetical protein
MSWTEKKSSAEAFFRQNDFEKAMGGYAAAAEAANDQKAGGFQDQGDDELLDARVLLRSPHAVVQPAGGHPLTVQLAVVTTVMADKNYNLDPFLFSAPFKANFYKLVRYGKSFKRQR